MGWGRVEAQLTEKSTKVNDDKLFYTEGVQWSIKGHYNFFQGFRAGVCVCVCVCVCGGGVQLLIPMETNITYDL